MNGYDAFGKGNRDLNSGYSSLESMRRIDAVIKSLISAEEDALSLIQQEQDAAFTEWNDAVDIELREVLGKALPEISEAKGLLIEILEQLRKCIHRRWDYLCTCEVILEGIPVGGKCDDTEEI